jgi:DNA-binding transcriptional ArsR family regulator
MGRVKDPKTDEILMIKEIIDGFYNAMSDKSKEKLYKEYKEEVDKRNKFINSITKKDKPHSESYMKISEAVRYRILRELQKSKYAKFINGINNSEISLIIGLSRERVRQILDSYERRMSSPAFLRKCMEKGIAVDIIDEAKEAQKRKARKKDIS